MERSSHLFVFIVVILSVDAVSISGNRAGWELEFVQADFLITLRIMRLRQLQNWSKFLLALLIKYFSDSLIEEYQIFNAWQGRITAED